MESGNGAASSKGVLVPVSASSDAFQNSILGPLKSAYLYEESKQSFRYKSAFLVKNPALEKKYNAFRAKRRRAGYSKEDLKESYGFLLFDDVNKAHALCETGVLTGNSTCTTLGDPSKGVYISMYSDCLDLNRWYHGKSGYIAIIKLTKGKVNKVLENYTQNFTAPTKGFDCHVSEQLPSVSAKTSSFLAFERTQYYIYELLKAGNSETAQSPSAACPFAIASFSYTDTKATLEEPEEKSEENKLVHHYFPWRGQLQIGPHLYDVGLRSTAGALIPAELPPVVKVERATSLIELRKLLPRTVFETCFTGEVFLDGLYCSLCELVSSETEQSSSLSQLLSEIKEKDVALTVPLNDGGFLILLHSSHFFTFDDTGSSAAEVLQGVFVFPDSRVVQRDTKFGQKKPAVSSDILRVLPALSYAEGEVEKTPTDLSEELYEVFAQHIQSYAAMINPGLALSPSRDISIFPDQYDVPDAHKHLYSSPEWTNRAWQNLKSYVDKPLSFQLPVSKASEILAAGQEERIEDLHDDVYFCLSSPEEAPASHGSMASEDQLTGEKSVVNVETSVDSHMTSSEDQVDSTAAPENECLQPGDVTKDTEKSDLTVLIKTDTGTKNLLTPSTSDDLPAELIVSITSAERTVTDSVISTESATNQNDFPLSGYSTTKAQMEEGNSLNDENVEPKEIFDPPQLTNHQIKHKKLHRSNVKNQEEESSGLPELSKPSKVDWRKARKRKRIFGTLSAKNRKLRSAAILLAAAAAKEKNSNPGRKSLKSPIVMEFEALPLRKKTERWDLKPVTSECGRILVPHGSVDMAGQIKALKDKLQSAKDEPCHEKMVVDDSLHAHDTNEMEQESSTASETIVAERKATAPKDSGNHHQDISNIHLGNSISRQPDGDSGSSTLQPESGELSSKDDGGNTSSVKTVQEKHTDTPSTGKSSTRGEFLLKKLKSVLLRGKRKMGLIGPEETTADVAQDTQPCPKKGKVDSQSGMLTSNDTSTCVQNTNVDGKDVSKILSVDPLFAFALGLTPKEASETTQKAEDQDTQQKKDSSETQEQTILQKQPQIIQQPLSIFPRRGRIKTLKKHQGISEENVKKKWWLHFQTPACFATEKLKLKELTRDNSVRKTVKEKHKNSACSSTDALTLLADLALSANNDQVPPQPDPALERKPETSLKSCDLTKDVTSGEQESVLHALLRQPPVRPIQPLESPSPSHFVGGSELVGLISKEHDYSLPPSSSLLLDLSGTPFHVSPLYGSTRLLHHHQTMYGDGIKILHHTIDQEDKSEQVSPEYLKKHMVRRRKFRQSRTFDSKDGSVQVTRQWKENYDFNQDSKFTNDSKERAIIRAIHGPWDLNIEDTNEEVRLIVHMWIGLFYSRSTARFFHLDSNLCSEESDSLEKSTGMVSAPPQSDLTAGSLAPCLNATDTSDTSISKALDLSKKDNSVLDQGPVILDLSIRNSVVENVTPEPILNKKETSVSVEKQASATLSTPKSPLAIKKCYIKSIHCPEVISGLIEARRNYKSKRTVIPLQKAVCLKQTDVPSFKGGGTVFSGQEEMETASPQLQNHQTASGTGHVSHGCNNAKRKMKDGIESTSAIEISLVQKQGRDSSKSEMDKGADFIREEGDVVLRVEHDEHESKDGENCQVKEKPCQEGSQGDDSTKEELGIVSNGNLLENKKRLCMEEPKTVSPGKAESGNENVDCCAVREDKVTEDDQSRKVDGLVEKDTHIPDVEAANDLNNQPLPMMCDGPDSEKEHCQTPVDEQQLQVDNKEDAYNNGELRKLCANGRGRTNEPTISVKVPPAPSETDPVDSEPVAVEENSENGPRLTDLSDQALPMRSDGPDSLKDCITECNDQTPLDEQRSEVNSEEEACHDAISEKAPSLASEMERIGCEIAVRKNSENGDCLADLSHQSGQMICEGPDSGKDSITDSSHQAPLDQQPPQAENEGAACHDLESSKLSAKGSAMSDKTPHVPSEMERIGCEIAVRKNSENGDCLADLSHQSIQMICEGPDSVKDSITDSSHQAPLDQQPPEGGNEGVACHDLESSKLSAKGSAMSDKTPHVPSEMEPIDLEIAVRKNSENGDCLADMSHQSIPMICEGPDSVKDSITDSSHQAPLDQQPPQAGNEGVACHDLESSKLSAKGSAVSGKTPHVPSEMEPIDREIAVRKNSENGVCLADLSHQSIPMICEGPDSVKVSITDSSHQAPLDQQPPQADNEGAACHDFELSKLSANGSAMTAEDAMPDKTPHTPSEMEATDCKIAVEENSENSSCLADLNVQQIPMICDNPDSVKMDNVAECSRQVPLDEQSPQADNKEDAGHDRNWHKLCANINSSTDEHAMPGKCPHAPAEVELADSSPVAKENSENYTCLPEKANLQRSVPSMLDDNTCSLGGASTDRSNAQTNTSAETGSQNNVMATLTVGHNDHKDHDTKLNERKENAGRTTQNELFYNQSDSPQCGILTSCKMEEALPHETHPESDETNRRLEKINGRVVIPFIGVDISGEDVVQSDDSYSEDSVEVQKETSGITKSSYPETVLPTEVCSTTQMHIRKEELLAHKVSHQSVANQTQVSVSECDERCPTPTMDEEPYQYETCIDPSSSSSSTSSGSFALSSCETWKNRTQQHFSRSSTFVEMPLEQKHKSAVDSDPNPQHGLRPDLELRTLRVLQSINKFLSETSHSDKSSQIKTSDMKHPVDQTDRLQETSVGNDYFHSQRSFTPTEFLQAFKPDIEERHKTSRTNTSNEPRSHSQRPVMAVRPSKSDEIQAPAVTYTTMSSMLLEKKTESLKRNSVGLNEKQEASDFSYESSFSNVRDSKCTLDEAKFAFQDPLYQHHGRDSLKVSSTASSLSVQSFKSAKNSSKLVDGHQSFSRNSLVEREGKRAENSIETDWRHCSDASASFSGYRDDGIADSLYLGPQSSLTCTVFNTSKTKPVSFLEQLSQRCLQDDLTLASMEQECLIFSEQMKQLLKRTTRGPVSHLDAHEKLNVSRSSPVTVHFSNLEDEEDDLVDHLDTHSLEGQKIMVDMSDRTAQSDIRVEENTQRRGNPMEHAGVSSITAESARLYKAIMNDVCAARNVPFRFLHLGNDRGHPKTEESNHFDFCDQMKREMDESFRSSLNSVVKKSCKTKYRFFILVTSDDAFFEETKAQLEAEGHTAVQPSDFFLDEDGSSSLLIILRNEDIAEHICEVPHLLELKKSPRVQFAGIDEPDDVVNLTHQELFMRGGFVMFDRATLESLSLCNMKKMSEILEELSRTGKWKWMLHYRDSRRMKENARLSAEAKGKTHFLNWCQEAGILEVLPYHECDLMSRDQPDYLTCLVRLQVQNISSRYPVFITDTTSDSAFGTNGILTMTSSSFLTCSPSETFAV